MTKIKEINQSYTMEEITAIVDELYPFGEYELNEKGQADSNPDYCDKEDLMNLFFSLNKCNEKLKPWRPIPLSAREKKQLIEERDNIYKQLQEKLNPEALQLSEEKEPQQVMINFYQTNYIQKNYTQNNNTQNNYSYAYTQSQKEDDSEIKEPQQAKHNRPITITDESLEEFRGFFISIFNGMGNNRDRFTENLIPELKECFTKIEVAKLLYACYKSKFFRKKNGKKKISWNKFKDKFCLLFSVERLPYKPNELGEPDYEKFYWLEPPINRQ